MSQADDAGTPVPGMQPDDHVCLCFRVSLRKVVNYMERERPTVASQLSECLGAGTGCQWCVPFLRGLHHQWQSGRTPGLPIAPAVYAAQRRGYRETGERPPESAPEAPPGPPSAAEG